MKFNLKWLIGFWYRNLVLLLLSIVACIIVLVRISRSYRRTDRAVVYSPHRHFSNLMIGSLFVVELLAALIWLVGLLMGSLVNGVLNWGSFKPRVADVDRWCFPVALANFWISNMIILWHGIFSVLIWAWVVRKESVQLLKRRLKWGMGASVCAAALFCIPPILEDNLGLLLRTTCYLRRFTKPNGQYTASFILSRFALLPLHVLMVVLNVWTAVQLQREARVSGAMAGGSRLISASTGGGGLRRLQIRLLLMTIVFLTIWALATANWVLHVELMIQPILMGHWGLGLYDAIALSFDVRWITPLCCCWRLTRVEPSKTFTSLWETIRASTNQHLDAFLHRAPPPLDHRTTSHTTTHSHNYPSLHPHTHPSTHTHPRVARAKSTTTQMEEHTHTHTHTHTRVCGDDVVGDDAHTRTLTSHPIFVTSFDMSDKPLPPSGEQQGAGLSTTDSAHTPVCGPLRDGLRAWIPLTHTHDNTHTHAHAHGGVGESEPYQLYVIAVQRCRNVARLRAAVHEHLGGPGRYIHCGTSEVMTSMNSKLALMVFARVVDVENNAFRLISTSRRTVPLRSSRSSNNYSATASLMGSAAGGVVGVAFRWYDVSMAVIAAHLPTDTGFSATEKDEAVSHVLRSLHLGPTTHDSCDTHLQYHHVVLVGSVRYGGGGGGPLSRSDVLDKIVKSSRTCERRLGPAWRPRLHPCTPQQTHTHARAHKRPSTRSRAAAKMLDDSHLDLEGGSAQLSHAGGCVSWTGCGPLALLQQLYHRDAPWGARVVDEAWAWVDKQDVLRQKLRAGHVLCGFRESKIHFPPTSGWRKGSLPGTYIIPSVVDLCFDTATTPAYTDRILHRSLPGLTHRLRAAAYDICDSGPLAAASTHRPVSHAFVLLLDTSEVSCAMLRTDKSGLPCVRMLSAPALNDDITHSKSATESARTLSSLSPSSFEGGGDDGCVCEGVCVCAYGGEGGTAEAMARAASRRSGRSAPYTHTRTRARARARTHSDAHGNCCADHSSVDQDHHRHTSTRSRGHNHDHQKCHRQQQQQYHDQHEQSGGGGGGVDEFVLSPLCVTLRLRAFSFDMCRRIGACDAIAGGGGGDGGGAVCATVDEIKEEEDNNDELVELVHTAVSADEDGGHEGDGASSTSVYVDADPYHPNNQPQHQHQQEREPPNRVTPPPAHARLSRRRSHDHHHHGWRGGDRSASSGVRAGEDDGDEADDEADEEVSCVGSDGGGASGGVSVKEGDAADVVFYEAGDGGGDGSRGKTARADNDDDDADEDEDDQEEEEAKDYVYVPGAGSTWRKILQRDNTSEGQQHQPSQQQQPPVEDVIGQVIVVFPLCIEDPLISLRRSHALVETLPSSTQPAAQHGSTAPLFALHPSPSPPPPPEHPRLSYPTHTASCSSSPSLTPPPPSSSSTTPFPPTPPPPPPPATKYRPLLNSTHAWPWGHDLLLHPYKPTHTPAPPSPSSSTRPPSATHYAFSLISGSGRRSMMGDDAVASHSMAADLVAVSGGCEEEEEQQGVNRGCGGASGVEASVLTLGPLPYSWNHALIKFVSKDGKDLGQGVFCVAGRRPPAPSPPSSPTTTLAQSLSKLLFFGGGRNHTSAAGDAAAARVHGGVADGGRITGGGGGGGGGGDNVDVNDPSSAAEEYWGRHTVELSVGGRRTGVVSFDMSVKTRQRVRRRQRRMR